MGQRLRVPPRLGSDDQRSLSVGQYFCSLLQRFWIGVWRSDRRIAACCRHTGCLHRRHQYLTWQADVNRASRFRASELKGALHYLLDGLGTAYLVVPLGEGAYSGRLVDLLLQPVDVHALASRQLPLGGVGSPAGAEDHACTPALGVVDGTAYLHGAGIHVHQQHLRLARYHVVAMGRRHRHLFIQAEDHLRHAPPLADVLGNALLDGERVGARVDEDVVDPVGIQ